MRNDRISKYRTAGYYNAIYATLFDFDVRTYVDDS